MDNNPQEVSYHRTEIYQRLLEICESGKYYDYYEEHVCNMDCFYKLGKYLNANNLREKYVELYLGFFREELEKPNQLHSSIEKLRETINPHVACHITPSEADLKKAIATLSVSSRNKFNRTFEYLNDFSAGYINLCQEPSSEREYIAKEIVLKETPKLTFRVAQGRILINGSSTSTLSHDLIGCFFYNNKREIAEIIDVNSINEQSEEMKLEVTLKGKFDLSNEEGTDISDCVMTAGYVKLFNALVVLSREEQISVLMSIVSSQLETGYANKLNSNPQMEYMSSFAEMFLKPGELCHGEIKLLARAALEVYDEEHIGKCLEFFRELDATNNLGIKMGL